MNDVDFQQQVLERLKRIEERLQPEPFCLTFPAAAARLGVGLTKLKEMVRRREIRAVVIGRVRMIPLSEIHRISTPPQERPKLAAKQRREAWVPIPIGKKRWVPLK